VAEKLEAKHSGATWLAARKVEYGENIDPAEVCYELGWTDGLPVTPPTDERVIAMLKGTSRKPDEIVGRIPPNLAECTVEKVTINAVMAGCKPEYMPVLLAAIEAALEPVFTLHGVLATTYFSSPVIIVNGPIVKRIGMNSGINALGQGNRANATIGRALNLIVRNVGGGRPGEVDRATLGAPSKFTLCFAEDESDPAWQPLAQDARHCAGQVRGDAVPGARSRGVCRPEITHARSVDEIVRDVAGEYRPSQAGAVGTCGAGAVAGALRHLP